MDSKRPIVRKRGEYAKFFPAVKIELAKYAPQHGVAATLNITCLNTYSGKHSKNLKGQLLLL